MADTVEEIYNQTLGTTSFAGGPVTAVTTDANTRYVIRDIDIERPEAIVEANAFNMTAKINNVQVADLTTGSVGGTSIMGPSSTLTLNSTAFPIPSANYQNVKFHYPRTNNLTSNGWVAKNNYKIFNISNITDNDAGAEASAISPSISEGDIFWHIDDKIFWFDWDGNSITNLYRRVPGTSTNDLINSSNYAPKVWDNYKKIYWVDGSLQLLYAYDSTTHTTTSTTITGPAYPYTQSSFPRAYFCNGFYWFVCTTDSTTIIAVNVSTSVSYKFTTPSTTGITSDSRFSVGYVPSEDKFYINNVYSNSNSHVSFRIETPLSEWNPSGETSSNVSNSLVPGYNIGVATSPAYLRDQYYGFIYQFGKTCYWRSTQSPYTTFYKAQCDVQWNTSSNISIELSDSNLIAGSGGSYFYYQIYNPSATEIAATSYDYSNFNSKVRITAVKSV